MYFYFDALVTLKEHCTVKVNSNIFLFQMAHFIIENNVKLNVKKQVSSYSLAQFEFGKNIEMIGKNWYILYNTTVSIDDNSSFQFDSMEIGGYTNVKIGKNVSFDITGNHVSPECKQNKTLSFCYSVVIRGAASVTIDNVKNHRPITQ